MFAGMDSHKDTLAVAVIDEAGRLVGAPAGHVGDPRRQTRTPHPHRTKSSLAGTSQSSSRRPAGGTPHGPHRPAPDPVAGTPVNARWITDAVGRVLAAMEDHRSTWQIWHVRAEAQRQVQLSNSQPSRVRDWSICWSAMFLRTCRCRWPGRMTASPNQRRCSVPTARLVYTVAGSELFTSTRILDAERRLIETTGRYDGRASSTSNQASV